MARRGDVRAWVPLEPILEGGEGPFETMCGHCRSVPSQDLNLRRDLQFDLKVAAIRSKGGLMLRRPPTAAVVFLAASLYVPAFAQEDSVQRSFGGDTVHLDQSVGNYRVMAPPDERIRVTAIDRRDGYGLLTL
jgi:hypothetical protein